jgi:hypothetical protein
LNGKETNVSTNIPGLIIREIVIFLTTQLPDAAANPENILFDTGLSFYPSKITTFQELSNRSVSNLIIFERLVAILDDGELVTSLIMADEPFFHLSEYISREAEANRHR